MLHLTRAQLTDLIFIHDNVRDRPKLLEVLNDVSVRDVRLDAADKHAVLLLGLPGGPHSAQRLVLPPFDVLIQARLCGEIKM